MVELLPQLSLFAFGLLTVALLVTLLEGRTPRP